MTMLPLIVPRLQRRPVPPTQGLTKPAGALDTAPAGGCFSAFAPVVALIAHGETEMWSRR